MKSKVKIGVLAIQGSVEEHVLMLRRCNVEVCLVRNKIDLDDLDGLILPGGESTAIKKILKQDGLWGVLQGVVKNGLPIWGTCAGMILLAELGVVDYKVKRNAYGAQLSSGVVDLKIDFTSFDYFKGGDFMFPAVFIRAPKFAKIPTGWDILAKYQTEPVFITKDNIWTSSFHPELTNNPIIHQTFIDFCQQ